MVAVSADHSFLFKFSSFKKKIQRLHLKITPDFLLFAGIHLWAQLQFAYLH